MRVQRVTAPDASAESWTVVDESFAVVAPVDEFLARLTVIERSPGTVRSYAFDLRDYFEFLCAHGTDWRTVRLEHLGRFVLHIPPPPRGGLWRAVDHHQVGRCHWIVAPVPCASGLRRHRPLHKAPDHDRQIHG
ncbi:site-specific integrase [Mycolicibacterium sp. XJ870]